MAITISQEKRKALTTGMHDALIDGEVIKDIPSRVVFVTSESELSAIVDEEPVGTIAIQYGFANMWQLKPDGQWATV